MNVARLRSLIAELWHTDEIRVEKPSPVDEAADAVNKLKGLFKF